MKGRVLIIAGSDSGGGAGIQADIKTVTALGGYAATAITAITVQDTRRVHDIHAIPPSIVTAQMRVVLADIGADVLKTGMLVDDAVIEAVASVLQKQKKRAPLILDPVMVSKSGHALLKPRAVKALKEKLLPLAALITPNIKEAEILAGVRIGNVQDMRTAAMRIHHLGAKAVLIKGGHMKSDTVTDILFDGKRFTTWKSPRIKSRHTHGTGCTLASAIATTLAQGKSLKAAVARARAYVQGAIRSAPGYGGGSGPMNHGWNIK